MDLKELGNDEASFEMSKTAETCIHLRIAPVDILEIITSFVDGLTIGKLLMCGDKQFTRNVTENGGITSFRLAKVARKQLPPSTIFFQLRKLRTIDIIITEIVNQESLTSLTPTKLPSMLVNITFKFKWAEWIWRTLSTLHIAGPSGVFNSKLEEEASRQMPVADLFPHLEKLELDGWSAIHNPFVLNLPPTLTHFGLLSNTFLTEACLAYLPRHLLTFKLPAVASLNDACLPQLPLTLTHLDVSSSSALTSKCFSKLPGTLEVVKLPGVKISPLSFKRLPRGLRSLIFTQACSPSTGATSPGFDLLPQTLTHLDISFSPNVHFITNQHIHNLPRSLLHLSLHCPSITDAALGLMPPNIVTLLLNYATKLSPQCLELMPKSVISIRIPGVYAWGSPADLPPSRSHVKLATSFRPLSTIIM